MPKKLSYFCASPKHRSTTNKRVRSQAAQKPAKEVSPPAIGLFFLKYVRPHRGKLALAGACLVASVLVHLARPWPLKIIFDYVLVSVGKRNAGLDFLLSFDPMTVVLGACLGVMLISITGGYFEYVHLILAGGVGQKVIYTIRIRLFTHIQRLSLGFHARSRSGDLLSRLIKEVNDLRDFLSDSAIQLVGDSIYVISLIAVMLVLDWRLTLLSVLLFPVLFFLILHFSGRIRGLTRKRLQRAGKVASIFNETLAAIQEVQLYSSEEEGKRRFRTQNRASLKADMKALREKGKLLRLVDVISAIGTCLVLWWGVKHIVVQILTPGDLLVFVSYLKSLHKPIRRVAKLSVQASKALVAGERIMQIFETKPEVEDAPDAVCAPAFRGSIEFRNVSFAYEPHRLVLKNLNFHVKAGQTVALLGKSGAGKSTLAALIPRLYDPTQGAVSIDGEDIRSYTLSSLRDQITVVPQDAVLFCASVRENITYGNPAADLEDIRNAARLANAIDFIEKLPEGFDTDIGERGARLSGGQRQRIAIARALLRAAPIVILDEPLTGVDTVSESFILKGLRNLLRQKTAFIIAHMLSTILNADQVVVLDEGGIIETGTPQELQRASGLFRRLTELQFGPQERLGFPNSSVEVVQ